MDFGRAETSTFVALGLGVALAILVPLAIALIWKFKKKEPFTTILIGAAVFFVFALILEKLLQNLLIFPTQMGLPDHAASQFINARPVLWAFLVGLFPGVFEETGRLVAFKTVLRKRRQRETSISYGIGHGGFEVMFLMGYAYIQYILYAVMINNGTFQTVVDQVAALMPSQVDTLYDLAATVTAFSFASLGLGIVERIFAFLFHVGASILVFYACRDKGKFWLYPLAIVLHTALDFIGGLYLMNLFTFPAWALEIIAGVFGILTFCGAYFLLYREDKKTVNAL